MGRRLRTTLPIACGLLEPEAHNIKEIRARMKYGKEKLKYYHDHRGTKELPPLKPGDFVRVKPETGSKEWKAATVVQQHTSPRSYIVDVGGRRMGRNRVAPRTDSQVTCRVSELSCKHRGGRDRSWETMCSAACSATTHARHTYGEATIRLPVRPVSHKEKPSKKDTAFTWSSSD